MAYQVGDKFEVIRTSREYPSNFEIVRDPGNGEFSCEFDMDPDLSYRRPESELKQLENDGVIRKLPSVP